MQLKRAIYFITFVCLIGWMLAGCQSNETNLPLAFSQEQTNLDAGDLNPEGRSYWPTDNWLVSDPVDQGLNGELLDEMFTHIELESINLHSVVIVKNGYIVGERYYPPYEQEDLHQLWSVTKSVVSALIGIAIESGDIPSVDVYLSDYFPDVILEDEDRRKADMTLGHLITMSSGLEWSDDTNIAGMYTSPSWPEYVLRQPLEAYPGELFNYNSGATHVLSAILEKSTGMSTLEYARERLFEPLGISELNWDRDRDGIYIGGWGLSLASRDMAKIGYLYLNEGQWDGRQIVPQDWVHRSMQKRFELDDPLEPWRLWYGYGWWIHEFGPYAAHGRDGQFIFVDPQHDLVVVFTSQLPGREFAQPAMLLRDYIIPAVEDN